MEDATKGTSENKAQGNEVNDATRKAPPKVVFQYVRRPPNPYRCSCGKKDCIYYLIVDDDGNPISPSERIRRIVKEIEVRERRIMAELEDFGNRMRFALARKLIAPPSSGRPTAPPSSGRPTVPPSSGRPTVPPSGRPTAPPSSGKPTAPPSSGKPTAPPSSGKPTGTEE